MTTTDRRFGVYGAMAFKVPVLVATTANITLSGLQTVDGVTLVADDRVLVKNQTTGSENGIYVASTGPWSRAKDLNGPYDATEGTMVSVTDGGSYSRTIFRLDTDDPVVGETTLTWTAVIYTGTSAGDYVDVNNYSALESGGDATAAVTTAVAVAVAAGKLGIYFSKRDARYDIANVSLPATLKVRGHPDGVVGPFGQAATAFTIAGDGVDIQGVTMQGDGSMYQAGGGSLALIIGVLVTGGLESGADSDVAPAEPAWAAATAYTGETSLGAGDGDKVENNGYVYHCLETHTSGADFDSDYAIGRWERSASGIILYRGGSGYVTTASDGGGSYFLHSVTDTGGTGGVIKCYVTAGAITRVVVTAAGSGYTADTGGGLMSIGRPYPGRWVYASGHDDLRIVGNIVARGQRGIDLADCARPIVNENRVYENGPVGHCINFTTCSDVTCDGNNIDTALGGLQNQSGIRVTGAPGEASRFTRITNNSVRNIEQGGQGITGNAATVRGLVINDNIVEGCGGAQYEMKHGANATGLVGGLPEADAGITGMTFTGNVALVPPGSIGMSLHNNLRDPYRVHVGPDNIIESIGAKIDPDTGLYTYGVAGRNLSDSTVSPTLRGKFYTGIKIATAFRSTFAPNLSDARCNNGVHITEGLSSHTLSFPGDYRANKVGVLVAHGSNISFTGTSVVEDRPVQSVALTGGTGLGCNQISSRVYFYANGGGYGLQLACVVTAGVISAPEITVAIQEDFQGAYMFDGGDGTARIDIVQDGGTGASVDVTVVNGEATAVSLVAGGSGYLNGGSTSADRLMMVKIGTDFVGYVDTNGSGNASAPVVVDGGGHFVVAPTFAFDSSVTWSTPPTLTATLQNSNIVGLLLTDVYGSHISNAYLQGYGYGARCVNTPGLDVNNTIFKNQSPTAEPYTQEDMTYLGYHRNVVQIPVAGNVPLGRTVTSNDYWSIGEENTIDTSAGAVTIKSIYGCLGRTTLRVSSASNDLTIDNTENVYLGGLGSILLRGLSDWATFEWNQTTAKMVLVNRPPKQETPHAATTTATLTAAQLLTGIVTVNEGAGGASNLTLPLGTDLDTALGLTAFPIGGSFDVRLINISTVAAEDCTILTAAGHTLVGSMFFPSYDAAGNNSSGILRFRKTAANTFSVYRIG